MERLEARQGAEAAVHRPVRRRLLFGLHGRRPGRRRLAPGRQRRRPGVVVGRQGHLLDRAGRRSTRRPARGTRVVLHLMDDAEVLRRAPARSSGWSRRSPAMCRCRSRSSRSPTRRPREIADGTALWTKPKAEIKPEEYTDFYRSVAGQYDEPALTHPLPRRGPAGIHRARLRARLAAVRSVRPATARAA